MSGAQADLTDKQKERLAKLRENLKDILKAEHDDVMLVKFLKARRFDLKKSEQMFRKTLQWREENKVDTVTEWYKVPEVLRVYWSGGVSGLDKGGHAIFIIDMGALDPRGILYSANMNDILKTNLYYMEELREQQRRMSTEKYGQPVEGVTILIDLEKMGLHHLWKPGIDTLQKVTFILEQHYPEVVHRMYIVKAPKIFPLAYSLMKPFLREDTRKKIQVLGGNWKEELLKHIDADQLPVYWGGSKTDPDGDTMCKSLIKLGGEVPKSFYLKDQEPSRTLTKHELSRGANLEIKYDVKNSSSVFRYEFQTESADIKFGFDRVDDKGKRSAVLLKQEKYNSHIVPEGGEVMVPEAGTYVAKFDNDSWTKTKKLSYWMELLEPMNVDPEYKEMGEDFARIDLNE